MRAAVAVALLGFAAAAVAAPAAAQSERYVPPTSPYTLQPGRFLRFDLTGAGDGDRFDVLVNASAPVDVLLLTAADYATYAEGGPPVPAQEQVLRSAFVRHVFTTRGTGPHVLVVDNTEHVPGGAPGSTAVELQAGNIPLLRPMASDGLPGLLRTIFLRQPHWQLPGFTSLQVAGPTLLFLALATVCTAVAHSQEREKDHWWLAFFALTVLGAAFTVVLPGVGFRIDPWYLLVPAGVYGYLAYRRTADTIVSVCAVFSVTFFASLAGVDVLTEIMHHREHVEDYLYAGHVGVIGGAGWADLLCVAPLAAVATFAGFRLLTRRTLLAVESSLQGEPGARTLHVKVSNRGERVAHHVQVRIVLQARGLADEAIHEAPIAPELKPGEAALHNMEGPARRAKVAASWTGVRTVAWAANAPLVQDTIPADLVSTGEAVLRPLRIRERPRRVRRREAHPPPP